MEPNRPMVFVKLLEQNRAILIKPKTSLEKFEKQQAAQNVADVWLKLYAETLTPKQVLKMYHNMKDSIKYILRENAFLPECWEKRLAKLVTDTIQNKTNK